MKRVLTGLAILIIAALYQPQALFAAPDQTIEKTFPASPGGKLELKLDTGGDIAITGWGERQIAITADVGGRDADEVELSFDPASNGLTIRSTCHKWRGCNASAHFTIKVPERYDVDFDSKGGGVRIEGVEGTMSGKTMGGALTFIRIKGEIHAETMGGEVTVEDSDADGNVSTMGGEVAMRNVKGNIKGSTMGGKVTYDNVTGRSAAGSENKEAMTVSTMGGDIAITGASENVRAKTMGGDVQVGKAKEVNVSTMGGDINVDEAPLGAAVSTMGGDIKIHSAGEYVKASTMGGDITVDAVDGGIKASTMGGDVVVTMVGDPAKGKRDVDLSSMGGDITLTVPAGLSMKFDIDLEFTKNAKKHPQIVSDFPMKIEETPEWRGHWGKESKHIYGTGTVGGGDNVIKIKTINSNIYIKKG
jgi:DUF4097 and DUF4098 domain-containing protein YvlB